MKTSFRSLYIQIAAIVLALSFGVRAHAEPPREQIAHAFKLLKVADHHYAGHRVLAMNELEAAGKDLGLDLKGDASERERQLKSDERLVEARRLLREARVKLEERDRDRIAARLEKAIHEIDAALKVK